MTAAPAARPRPRPRPRPREFRYLFEKRDTDGRLLPHDAPGPAATSAAAAPKRAGAGARGGDAADKRPRAGAAGAGGTGSASPAPAPAGGVAAEVLHGMEALLKARKLCLVLDLDHTLVNSAKFGEIEPDVEYILQDLLAQQVRGGGVLVWVRACLALGLQRVMQRAAALGLRRDAPPAAGSSYPLPNPHTLPTLPRPPSQVGTPDQELFRLPRVSMWTKLRPGVRDMLRHASERFELWIHTAGNRSYAAAMAELLGAHYFGQRIIAQEDGAEEAQVCVWGVGGSWGCGGGGGRTEGCWGVRFRKLGCGQALQDLMHPVTCMPRAARC
jgi:hypothetical protein